MSLIAELTQAARLAEGNFAKNVDALKLRGNPAVAQAISENDHVEWVFARDGTLTALEADGSWYAGCSVPSAAGAAMVESVVASGSVGLFLAPPHGATVDAVLKKIPQSHAVIAMYLSDRDFLIALHCVDFAQAIRANRLFFVHGSEWAQQLGALFRNMPGIPVPTYMIRVLATQGQADAFITPAMKVLEEESARRSNQIAHLRKHARPRANRVCVIGAMDFRLWADAGYELAQVVGAENAKAEIVDLDRLDQSSPVALALAASRSDAIVAANLSRSDVPQLVADEQPWITWVTTPRIPKFVASSPGDGLIVAHPRWREIAIESGWPAERVVVGTWPDPGLREYPQSPASISQRGDDVLLINGCATTINKPEEFEFSSHRLLWEQIHEELAARPLSVGDDLDTYLNSRMRRFNIAVDGLHRDLFIAQLILPAFMNAIACRIPAKTISGQQIKSREDFHAAVASAGALVDAWPFALMHPVRHQPRPFVRILPNLSLSSPISSDNMPGLSCDMIHRLLRL